MGFPVTSKYFLRFLHSSTGLTPVFSLCKRADTMADVTPPAIVEVGNGTYYFAWTFTTANDPDLIFEIDGGASIPTEEVRYIGDTISPKNFYLDSPVSQVPQNVWGDNASYSSGQKGKELDDSVGTLAAIKGKTDLIGGAPATSSDLTTLATTIMGAGGPNLAQLGGTGFVSAQNSLKALGSVVGTLTPPDNATIASIWNKVQFLPNDTSSLFGQISDMLVRTLGMLHENSVLDKTTFDQTTNNLVSARYRIYSTRDSAIEARRLSPGDYDTDKIAEYALTADYLGANLMRYLVSKEWPLPV